GALLVFGSGYLSSKSSLQPVNIMVVYVPIVSVRAFSIGQAVFPYLEKLVSHDIVLRILSKYRERLYSILEPQAMFLRSRFQTGDLLILLSDDIQRLQDFYIKTMLPSIAGVVVYGMFALVIGFFDVPFMLMMLAILGIIVFVMPLVSYYLMVRNHMAVKEIRSQLYEHGTDSMFGQLDWLVSGRVDEVLNKIAWYNKQLMKRIAQINHWHVYRDFLLQIIIGFSVISVMVWADYQTGEGAFSPTIIASFTLMMFAISDALLPISNAVEEVPTYHESLQRMNKLTENSSVESSKQWEASDNPTLFVQSVRYQYPESTERIIDGVSFTVKPGEKIAILGRSGAGKSTLLKLLAGLIQPGEGTIHLDQNQVHDGALAKSISILNQKPHLFHTTVANNVRIGNENATDEQIKEALQQAEIWELIE